MFISYGNLVSNSEETIKKLEEKLNTIGLNIAYSNEISGTIFEEVPDPNQDDENA